VLRHASFQKPERHTERQKIAHKIAASKSEACPLAGGEIALMKRRYKNLAK